VGHRAGKKSCDQQTKLCCSLESNSSHPSLDSHGRSYRGSCLHLLIKSKLSACVTRLHLGHVLSSKLSTCVYMRIIDQIWKNN
jgi:hypothetical protein